MKLSQLLYLHCHRGPFCLIFMEKCSCCLLMAISLFDMASWAGLNSTIFIPAEWVAAYRSKRHGYFSSTPKLTVQGMFVQHCRVWERECLG